MIGQFPRLLDELVCRPITYDYVSYLKNNNIKLLITFNSVAILVQFRLGRLSKMSSKNLIDLCDDTLYYIFDFLPTEDRISLTQVSQRFRNVFVDKYGSKYSEYTLIAASPRQELIQFCICCKMVKSLTIDLDYFDTNRYFRNYGFISPKNCFQILCHSLAGMVRLEHLSIKQLKDLVTPIKRLFYQLLEPIRQLPDLKSLQIVARDGKNFVHIII